MERIAALVLVGAVTLLPTQASAATFTWSFFDAGDAETISGTVDVPEGLGVAATSVIITNDGSLTLSTPQQTIGGTITANTWDVVGGVITAVDYDSSDFDPGFFDQLRLFQDPGFTGFLHDGLSGGERDGPLVFVPTTDPDPDPGNGVPEPGTLALLGLGLVGVASIGRRRR